MPRQDKMYLVRSPEGTMHTILAQSVIGAAKAFVAQYAVASGDTFLVKERGSSDAWAEYQA